MHTQVDTAISRLRSCMSLLARKITYHLSLCTCPATDRLFLHFASVFTVVQIANSESTSALDMPCSSPVNAPQWWRVLFLTVSPCISLPQMPYLSAWNVKVKWPKWKLVKHEYSPTAQESDLKNTKRANPNRSQSKGANATARNGLDLWVDEANGLVTRVKAHGVPLLLP